MFYIVLYEDLKKGKRGKVFPTFGEIYTKILYFIYFSRSPEKPFPFSPFFDSRPYFIYPNLKERVSLEIKNI